jgi:CRP-like cAMP-binding protein
MDSIESHPGSKNYFLRSLPQDVFERISPDLELVDLERGTIIYHAQQIIRYVLFPTTAVFSWVTTTTEGERVETGIIGWEGMIGASIVLGYPQSPYQTEVQIAGAACQLRADIFQEEFMRSSVLQNLVLRYTYAGLVQLAQSAACNRFHSVEARLCRWLLTASDRLSSDQLLLTQETLAGMIGAQRPAVTIAIGILQSAGLIEAKRGVIRIIDRELLEAASCECYSVFKRTLNQFLDYPNF